MPFIYTYRHAAESKQSDTEPGLESEVKPDLEADSDAGLEADFESDLEADSIQIFGDENVNVDFRSAIAPARDRRVRPLTAGQSSVLR